MDDQEKIQYEQIPDAIRDVFRRLEVELINLCFRWKLFRQLYRASDLRSELLNRTAPDFFAQLRSILLYDVVLGISRLTDDVTTGKYRNLVFKQLQQFDLSGLHADVVTQFRCELTNLYDAASRFRVIRDKHLAHLDFDAAIGTADSQVSVVKYADVDAALEAMVNAMNTLRIAYTGGSMLYEDLITTSDASSLVGALARSVVFDEFVEADWTLRNRLHASKYWQS